MHWFPREQTPSEAWRLGETGLLLGRSEQVFEPAKSLFHPLCAGLAGCQFAEMARFRPPISQSKTPAAHCAVCARKKGAA